MVARPSQTLHLVCDTPDPDALALRTAGATVVDLTQHGAAQAVDAVVDPELFGPEHTERTLQRYLQWFVAACSTGGPRALAYDVQLSMWWLMPFAIHNYDFHGSLPLTVQRGLWWLDHGASTASGAALAQAREIIIWTKTRAEGAVTAAFLKRAGWTAKTRLVGVDGRRWKRRLSPKSLLQRVKQETRPHLGLLLTELASIQQNWGWDPPTRDDAKVDVLIATQYLDWTKRDGVWANRYLGDTVARMKAEGLRVAWLPNPRSRAQVDTLAEILAEHEEPTFWSTPDLSRRAVSATRVARTFARYGRYRARIQHPRGGHPALALDGVDLSPVLLEQMDRVMLRLPMIASTYEKARAAVSDAAPRAVLLRNEFQPIATPIICAATRSSPVFGFQHGNIPRDHWLYRRAGELVRPVDSPPSARCVPSPDRMLVYGGWERELMTSTGYPDGAIVELGSLRHDQLFERAESRTPARRQALREELGLPPASDDAVVVLICAQLPQVAETWLQLLLAGAREAGLGLHVAYRSHPYYNSLPIARQYLDEAARNDATVSWSVADGDLFDLLESADVMLSGWSTTVVEAAILGTPVIACQTSAKRVLTSFVAAGLAPTVSTVEEITAQLRELRADGFAAAWDARRKAYLEEYMVNARQPAVRALAQLVRRS